MQYVPTVFQNSPSTATPINKDELNKLGVAVADIYQMSDGVVLVESFDGTAAQKLTQALDFAKAEGVAGRPIPWVLLGEGTYDLAGWTTYVPFTGMRIMGSPGFASAPKQMELSPATLGPTRVIFNGGTGASSMFSTGAAGGNVYDVVISNIGFTSSNAASAFWDQTASVLYAAEFHSLAFYGFKHIFGTVAGARKCLFTQVDLTGQWQVLGHVDVQFYIGGSDNTFWMGGQINIGGSGGAAGASRYMIWLDQVGKTDIGFIYATAKNGWRGIRVTGTGAQSKISFYGGIYEGMNKDDPCAGNVIRLEEGCGALYGVGVGFAMTAPDASEHGIIEVTAGEWTIDSPVYWRATGIAETVPLVYASGTSNVEVRFPKRDQRATYTPGAWTGRPRIQNAGTGIVKVDEFCEPVGNCTRTSGWVTPATAGITAGTGFGITSGSFKRINEGQCFIRLIMTSTNALTAGDIANLVLVNLPAIHTPSVPNGSVGGGLTGVSHNSIADSDGTIKMTTLHQNISAGGTFEVTGTWVI
jgi:hypothetical protein